MNRPLQVKRSTNQPAGLSAIVDICQQSAFLFCNIQGDKWKYVSFAARCVGGTRPAVTASRRPVKIKNKVSGNLPLQPRPCRRRFPESALIFTLPCDSILSNRIRCLQGSGWLPHWPVKEAVRGLGGGLLGMVLFLTAKTGFEKWRETKSPDCPD